ncbi:MAG TPA: sugar phosphate isomerase/epimerase [Tepidisphaeraceae bacterium]|nr:sugar phosphate isomerase/epimerase [Tepidisphaeraceae bacterium]
MAFKTKTGGFPIGFRRGWSDWQKKSTNDLARWANENGFGVLDLGGTSNEDLAALKANNIQIGTADVPSFGALMSKDASERATKQHEAIEGIKRMCDAGVKWFFTCILPGDVSASRIDNYNLAVEVYKPIAEAAHAGGGALAVEGYPGSEPHLPAPGCTPETVRAFLKDIPRGFALNYDPSHLIRLGVCPIRFLQEFVSHVRHVHGKDTMIDQAALYEFGRQPATFSKPRGFGGNIWRYTLPGHGLSDWPTILKILHENGFKGAISVELEDDRFNGTEAGEKEGLIASANFLAAC